MSLCGRRIYHRQTYTWKTVTDKILELALKQDTKTKALIRVYRLEMNDKTDIKDTFWTDLTVTVEVIDF